MSLLSDDPWYIQLDSDLSESERRMLLAIQEGATDGAVWRSYSPRLGRLCFRYRARRSWVTPLNPLDSEELAACTWLALGGYVTNTGELTERGMKELKGETDG